MANQLTTTLKRIKAHKPRHAEWKKLLACLGKTEADDEPLPFATILRITGLNFALWCAEVSAEPQHEREWLLFFVWCVRRVQHLLTDPRELAALDVAERHTNGMASDDELRAAWAAAWDDVWASVGDAAAAAAGDDELRASWDGAGDAWNAVWHAAREAQAAEFLRLVGGE